MVHLKCTMAGHGTFQECHKLAFYPRKPIIKYSSSLLVYIAELTTFTCGIYIFNFVMMHGDNLIYRPACEI